MAIKKQTFMNGVLIIMISQILIKLLGFIYRIILTNFPQFADEGNSYYGSGYQVYTFILAIATMGIPNTISKLVSEKMAIGDKRGAHRIFRTAMVVFTFIAVLFSSFNVKKLPNTISCDFIIVKPPNPRCELGGFFHYLDLPSEASPNY